MSERLGTVRLSRLYHLSQLREVRVHGLCSGLVLSLDPFVDLTPVYGHFGRGLDTQADLFALHIEHSDSDVIPDNDALA